MIQSQKFDQQQSYEAHIDMSTTKANTPWHMHSYCNSQNFIFSDLIP